MSYNLSDADRGVIVHAISEAELSCQYALAEDLRAILTRASAATVGEASDKPIWRCFHCDETFNDAESAALHFGKSEMQSPACLIDIAEYRAMEQRMHRYNEEDTDLHREIHGLRAKHQVDLMREEEKGYARGLADGMKEAAQQQAEPGADERAAFENWMRANRYDVGTFASGEYHNMFARNAWMGWQARAAQSGQRAANLSEATIQALWDEACNDSPQNPGWSRHIRFARAIEQAGQRGRAWMPWRSCESAVCFLMKKKATTTPRLASQQYSR